MQANNPKIFYGICISCFIALLIIFIHQNSKYRDIKIFEVEQGSCPKDPMKWFFNAERTWRLKTQERHQKYSFLDSIGTSANLTIPQLWSIFKPEFPCPFNILRVGRSGDGGKWVCGVQEMKDKFSSGPSPVMYSFGVNSDSSFEADMMQRINCSVYAYDPSVRSIAPPLLPSNPKVKFFPLGLSGNDSERYKTLKTLMSENGHGFIDVLKVDIEGYEYTSLFRVMDDFSGVLPFDQLLVELHVIGPYTTMTGVRLIEQLEKRGLRMVHQELNDQCPQCCEYTFININSCKLLPCEVK